MKVKINIEGKYVPGYDKKYIVTENGEVYSAHKKGWLIPEKIYENKDYFRYNLCYKGKPKKWRLHRLVAFVYRNDELQELLQNYSMDELVVHHVDNNVLNNHYTNLKWMTKYQHDLLHAGKL